MDPFNTVFVVLYKMQHSFEELILGVFTSEFKAQKAIKELKEKHPDWPGSWRFVEYTLDELCDEP